MDRAIFTAKEFLLISLALNNAQTGIFKNGAPGFSMDDISMLRKKTLALGTAGAKAGKPGEVFTLRDDEPVDLPTGEDSWKIPPQVLDSDL